MGGVDLCPQKRGGSKKSIILHVYIYTMAGEPGGPDFTIARLSFTLLTYEQLCGITGHGVTAIGWKRKANEKREGA